MSSPALRRLLKAASSISSARILKHACRSSSNVVVSALTDIEVPNTTIQEFVYQNFNRWPHKTAVECGLTGKKFTYEEIRTKSKNLNASFRKKLKLKRGDVVAVLLPNIPEYPICVFGALEAALVVTTINPLYTPEEICNQLVDSDTKAIITLTTLWQVAEDAAKLARKHIPILTIKMQESDQTPDGSINFADFTDTRCDLPDVAQDPHAIALMPYSSGTTGLPKGVELTHRAILANLAQINHPSTRVSEYTTETHQDVIPGILPWFHIYGVTVVMVNFLYNIGKLVSLPKFTPELYLNTLINYKPDLLLIVPPIINFMSTHASVKKEYLEPVRCVISGAAPLGALDEQRFLQKADKYIDMLQGYGLTETSPCVCMTVRTKKKKLGLYGSSGEVVSNTKVKVVPADNPSGDALGPNELGELLVKGPQVMKGYHNKPKETDEVFLDGWLRTGDLVYYDENKMFYITDRLKEMIKVKGFQVAPAELETIIRGHPEVADVAVIGIPHAIEGEVPRAYVVPKQNVRLDTAKLKDYVAGKVASFKQLKGGVAVVECIPKNPSGKILRRTLKQQYEKENK